MLIGISGLAGSGKDTSADFLVREHDFVKVSFADPMKRACRDIFDFSQDQLWGPSEMRNAPDERYPRQHTFHGDSCLCCGQQHKYMHEFTQCFLTPRYALQQLGTEWGRNCYSNVWVDYALRVAEKIDREGGYEYNATIGLQHQWRPGDPTWRLDVVISDVRYINEIIALRKYGAKLIRIVRPGVVVARADACLVRLLSDAGAIADDVSDAGALVAVVHEHAAAHFDVALADRAPPDVPRRRLAGRSLAPRHHPVWARTAMHQTKVIG